MHTPVRILVAEDAQANQKVIQQFLTRGGYQCDVAANGREALEKLAQATYDLVLMDCQMPEMDGCEATRRLREREGAGRHTPVIAMTASAMNEDREQCFSAGMDDYIAKPVNRANLYALLHHWLEGKAPAQRPLGANAPQDPAPDESGPPPVQLDYLMQSTGNDPVFLQGLIAVSLKEQERHLEGLLAAQETSDVTQMEFHAHALKNGAMTLRAHEAAGIALNIEVLARGGEFHAASELVGPLREACGRVTQYLKRMLEELRPGMDAPR